MMQKIRDIDAEIIDMLTVRFIHDEEFNYLDLASAVRSEMASGGNRFTFVHHLIEKYLLDKNYIIVSKCYNQGCTIVKGESRCKYCGKHYSEFGIFNESGQLK